jgi:DNA polymerase III gamma/tau subunit
MRAFDLLAKAETDIRTASHPRYHFEMMLLRWMHLRKLVPLADLMEQLGAGGASSSGKLTPPTSNKPAPATANRVAPASARVAPASDRKLAPAHDMTSAATSSAAPPPATSRPAPVSDAGPGPTPLKDRLLAEIRAAKGFFYNTVVAQAQRIEVTDDHITFAFLPAHRALREQFDQNRPWLESVAERLAGRKIPVMAIQVPAAESGSSTETTEAGAGARKDAPAKRDLKAEAMSSTAVQAMLDVFPAEIRDVEEM